MMRVVVVAHRDGEELPPEDEVEEADHPVERRRLPDFLPRDGENVAHEHVLEVLAFRGRLAHRQNRRRGRHRVADADDRFLRNPRALAADGREHERADEGEREADPVDHRRMGIAVRPRRQQRDGGAERRDLRQRQVDENHAALDDVHAEVGVNAREDQAGRETRQQERQHRCVEHYFVPPFLIASTSRLMS